jgi:glutathione S-transferase
MGNNSMDNPTFTFGYHKIRGLAAPLRMMFYYKEQSFTDVAYGSDMATTWFSRDKPDLLKKNSLINLPYIVDGENTITQSTTCMLYLGKKLGIDEEKNFFHNHAVLDQAMDLRNDLMKVVYPFAGIVKNKAEFPAGAKKHLEGSAKPHLTKLEGFCKEPFMCGESPQSGDFQVFEMLDQHQSICKSIGEPDILDSFPKMKKLHESMKAVPTLSRYFQSPSYKDFAQNNGLYAVFTGKGDDFNYTETTVEQIWF